MRLTSTTSATMLTCYLGKRIRACLKAKINLCGKNCVYFFPLVFLTYNTKIKKNTTKSNALEFIEEES